MIHIQSTFSTITMSILKPNNELAVRAELGDLHCNIKRLILLIVKLWLEEGLTPLFDPPHNTGLLYS